MRAMTEENIDLEFKFGRPLVNVKVIVPSFEELKISLKKKKKEKEIQFSKFTQASSICMFSKVPHVISSHPSWLRTHRCGCDGYKEA